MNVEARNVICIGTHFGTRFDGYDFFRTLRYGVVRKKSHELERTAPRAFLVRIVRLL
jgi:hypothetical protein